jgi:hypothetical protein
MNVDLQQPPTPIVDDYSKPTIPARIGLRWGALFWAPAALLVILLAGIAYFGNTVNGKPFAFVILAIPAPPLLVLLFAGRWWATRGLGVSEWMFLMAAIAQGLALYLSILLSIAAATWFAGINFFAGGLDFDSIVDPWGICSIWTLALGAVVLWRVARAEKLAHQRCVSMSSDGTSAVRPNEMAAINPASGDARPAQVKGLGRFAVTLIASLGLPILLSAPVVLMLRYDTSLRRSANAILTSEIGTIGAQIADIKDLNKVKSRLLARKQIVEELQVNAPRAANVFGIASRLPNGVQLLSLEMNEGHVALAVRCAAPSTELAILDLLAQSGYRNLQIAARQREGDDAVERISIEADSTRGDTH